MSIKISTGLRNAMLASSSVKGALDDGFVNIYAGSVPATADDTISSATLLCTISVDSTGTGVTFDAAAASGVLAKNSGEIWSGINVESGTATFYRHVGDADTGASSTTQPRIQGTISTAGADLNFTSTSLVNGAPQIIDFYTVAMPSV